MWSSPKTFLLCVVALLLIGCAGVGTLGQPTSGSPRTDAAHARLARLNVPQHVIIVVQENRSVDNLFQTLPGADTQNFGLNSKGQTVPLTQIALGANYDPGHSHGSFVTEFNNGQMNGFDKEGCGPACPRNTAYTYVNPSDITQYTQLATQYAFADHVLQPNEGPSFPGHIYLIAGQSGTPGSHWYVSENPRPGHDGAQDCLANSNHTVKQIDMTTPYPGVEGNPIFPCVDPPTVLDELDAAGIEWRYYTSNAGSIWTAPYAVQHLFTNPADKARVIIPETTVLSDIQNNTLAPVSYVIPRSHNSDHPGNNNSGGPAWVASIVNAVGSSNYWPNTAIIVVWDDWGGWYDHYVPTHPPNPLGGNPDPYEYGFRVPLLAIGMTAKSGFIDHTPRSSAAIVHFIEDVYGLSSLGTLDAQSDDLFGMFNFSSARRTFHRIPTGNVTIERLRRLPPDPSPVDSN